MVIYASSIGILVKCPKYGAFYGTWKNTFLTSLHFLNYALGNTNLHKYQQSNYSNYCEKRLIVGIPTTEKKLR